MELKTARLTLLIDPNKKAALERLCAQQDLTASQVVRQLIHDYLAQHGVQYVPSGVHVDDSEPVDGVTPALMKPALARDKPPPVKRRVARRPGS
ncbi:ribbon-helix-helix domain-containing protein [Polaromonas sp. P1(28)-13]|nr:ribbon-helix-helix domain-containing protein [Polaromonas sp. P1(28)-13]